MHTATNVGGDFEIVGDDVYPLPSPPPAPSPSPTRRTIRRTPARCTSGGFCRGLRGYDAFTRWASSIAISASTISSFRATPLLDRSSAISRAGGGTISRPKSARNPSSVPRGQPSRTSMISASPSKAKLFILGLKTEFFVGRPWTLGLKPLCLADAIRTFYATLRNMGASEKKVPKEQNV
jgi:hypothetical protein